LFVFNAFNVFLKIILKDRDIHFLDILQLYRPFQYCSKENIFEIKNNSLHIKCCLNEIELFDKTLLYISNNTRIYNEKKIKNNINYEAIKYRMHFVPEGSEICLKEAIIRDRFHPRNIDKWISWGYNTPEDFE